MNWKLMDALNLSGLEQWSRMVKTYWLNLFQQPKAPNWVAPWYVQNQLTKTRSKESEILHLKLNKPNSTDHRNLQ